MNDNTEVRFTRLAALLMLQKKVVNEADPTEWADEPTDLIGREALQTLLGRMSSDDVRKGKLHDLRLTLAKTPTMKEVYGQVPGP